MSVSDMRLHNLSRERIARFAAFIVLPLLLGAAAEQGDAIGRFYRDNQINLVVGSGPGGSHDLYARLLARHLGRHVSGTPPVVVQNFPGASGMRGANYLYNFAPRDGTAIGMFARNVPLLGLLGGSNVQFDPRKFVWLGSPASFQNDANILIVRKDAPVKSIEEARRPDLPPLILGGSAEGGISNDVPIILHDTIGLHVKQVVGYPDSPAIFAAIERGEVHGRTVDLSTLKSVRPDWLKSDGAFRILVQFGRATRHPQLPDVPTARELARNEAARSLIELAELPYSVSRPVAAPPGIPAKRAAALARAFRAVQNDPQYLEDAASSRLDVSPIDGDEILRAIEAVANAPPEFLEYARKLFVETKGGG
jgi:tripartite-type tricarboxylate transporter receptor subunit TctC